LTIDRFLQKHMQTHPYQSYLKGFLFFHSFITNAEQLKLGLSKQISLILSFPYRNTPNR